MAVDNRPADARRWSKPACLASPPSDARIRRAGPVTRSTRSMMMLVVMLAMIVLHLLGKGFGLAVPPPEVIEIHL
ncbi:MAG: hypothetical protein WD600_10765 [Pseudohongiella sp.]